MEKVADHIKLAEIKQESIPELFDQGHGGACSIVSFDQLELSSKFSFLKHEKELDLKAKNIAETIRVLQQRDKEVELKSNKVEARIDCLQSESKLISSLSKWIQDFSVEVNSKERLLKLALKDIEKSILKQQEEHEECSKELAMKKVQLGIIEKSIEQQNEEFKSNEEKLGLARMKLEECSMNLSVKNKQLESVEELLQVRCKEFEVKQKEVENLKSLAASCDFEIELKQTELTMKTREFDSLKETMRTYCQDLELKAREFNGIQESIRERNEELALKENLLKSIQMSITERCEQVEAQKEKLSIQQLEVTQCSEQLESKYKNLDLVRIALNDCCKELESKEKNLKLVKIALNDCCKELESKENHLKLVKIALNDCCKELELEEKNLKLVKISLKECCNNLTSKEAQFDSMQGKICGLREEIKEREKYFDATCQNRHALEPFHVLTDDMDDNDLLPNELLDALNSSADPAMFVLCVMRHSRVKTKILLMEKVIEISPRISHVVNAEAAKQAVSWKENLSSGSETLTEIWAFLLFLASYRLVHYFGGEDILKLVLVVAAKRNAPDLCRLLDITDKIPEIIEILIERKQHIDAARFTIAFGLLHIFPLQVILQNCFEHIKGKAIDEELSVLKAVSQCLSDYKVDSRIDMESTLHRIFELENERAFCSRAPSLSTHASFNTQQQPLHNQNYRDELVSEVTLSVLRQVNPIPVIKALLGRSVYNSLSYFCAKC